jgi:hypothetical protein
MNASVVPAPTWVHVVTVAGRRCECAGACGRAHKGTGGRCVSEHGRARPLYAAPRDPGVPAGSAWRLPVEELAAWCGPCLDAARRRATLPVTATVAEQLAVVDVAVLAGAR